MRVKSWYAAAFLFALVMTGRAFAAEDTDRPRLYTNEAFVEDATRATTLPTTDLMAMLAFVLGSLPDSVRVYPTENYYYFSFYHNSTRYAGNIRLDASDRDEGKLHFAYYEDLAEYKEQAPVLYQKLDKSNGVTVEKVERLVYRVSYGDKSVVFRLNDLSAVKPPASIIGPDEKYIGPIFDESAIRFFLIFNKRLKLFHYVLDETIPVADRFVRARQTSRIVIGKRTGFAFYQDYRLKRKILIGVFEGNARVNNYFDGPFDQLPDNFIEGETLREAILAVEPSLTGKIDRFGGAPDGSGRYLIGPYLYYRTEEQFGTFHDCATHRRRADDAYYRCFVHTDEAEAAPVQPRPARKTSRISK
ncbi:MAG TPA: hypothetical protein VN930_07615 [Xanthobacteraceae bacterium]|nr:hypothetical protein [Xanthobacteraceae bacterium]